MYLALFILLFVAQPTERVGHVMPPQRNESQPAIQSKEKEGQGDKEPASANNSDRWGSPIVVVTSLLFVIGIIQAVILFRTISSARDGSSKQLRAYLGIDGSQPIAPELARLTIKNHGLTPAYHVAAWITWALDTPQSIDFKTMPPPPEKPTYAILEPSKTVHLQITITPEERTKIQGTVNTDFALWYAGEIHYVDVFGETHWRKFRFRTNMKNNPNFIAALTEEGNETDDSEKYKDKVHRAT